MLDQAIKRGFIAENKLNQVAAEFSLVDQLSPLGGLSLTSSPEEVGLPPKQQFTQDRNRRYNRDGRTEAFPLISFPWNCCIR